MIVRAPKWVLVPSWCETKEIKEKEKEHMRYRGITLALPIIVPLVNVNNEQQQEIISCTLCSSSLGIFF